MPSPAPPPLGVTRVRRASLTAVTSAGVAATSLPNALHHQLLDVGTRSRAQSAPSIEFHDALLKGDTARKSMRTFKGQAKGMLQAILLALLVRLLLVVVIVTVVMGGAAWFLLAQRGDEWSDSLSDVVSRLLLSA